MRKVCSLVVILLALATAVGAQSQNGSVAGVVRDPQGAVVPGADVALQGVDATRRFTTELDGAFRFLNLEPGTYRVTATLSGFAPSTRTIIVGIGKHVDAAMELALAPLSESVTVSAPSPMVDAKATGTSTTVARDEL